MQMHFLLERASAFHHLRSPALSVGFRLRKGLAQLLIKPAHLFAVTGCADGVFTFRRQAVQLRIVSGCMPVTASKVDVNTLKPEQAALLAAMFPGKITQDDAVRLIESRPETGWENMETFSNVLEQAFPQVKDDLPQVAGQLSTQSRYFRVNYTGNTDALTLRVVSQLQVNNEAGEIVTWQRRYRMIE